MIDFNAAWKLAAGKRVAVSDGLPPPSTNKSGRPYKVWASSNFNGTIVKKSTRHGFRVIAVEVDSADTGPQIDSLVYEIIEGRGHSFKVL